MSDIDFLNLAATFSGFRIMVLANRLGCTNDLARNAHDRLARALAKLNEDMRKGLAAERDLLLNTDPNRCDDLGETLWCCERNFDELRCDPEGIDLLENSIHVDWGTREWYDPRTKAWVAFFDALPPVLDAAGEELCGLDKIIMQIREETGIRFTTFMSGTDDDEPDWDDVDVECYEDLHGFDGEGSLSAIHVVAHGDGRRIEG